MVATILDDGSVKLSADEHAIVVEALALAKSLCRDMEADKHLVDDNLVEVPLLKIIERLDFQ